MKIYIPSKGRPERQGTYHAVPELVRKARVKIVVDEEEHDSYAEHGYPLLVHPAGMRIPEVRQWIWEKHHEEEEDKRLVMLDDDLQFGVRRKDHPGRFRPAEDEDVIKMFGEVNVELILNPHVGVCAREGGNRFREKAYMTRMVRVLAYNTNVLAKIDARFDRVPLMEDFDVSLQLLRKGYPTCMITDYVQGQGKSNDKGGCSTYRTPEMQEQAALKLAELHPGFVKTVRRKTKSGWFEGGERTDVRISWKAAYESGCDVAAAEEAAD